MKFVSINTGFHGSTGKIMISIANKLQNASQDVYTYSAPIKSKYDLPERHNVFGNSIENRINRGISVISGIYGYGSFWGTYVLLRKIERIKPDVIHLHNLHGWYINLPMLFRYIKKHKIRTFWTLHDCWAFTGQCSHFTIEKCNKWKTGCYDCQRYMIYPYTAVDRTKNMYKLKKKWFCGVEDMTIITPSQWLADLVKQSYLKDYPVKVINNGIDLSIFKPTESDFRKKCNIEEKLIVLGVAFGWGERKGLDVFVELSKRLDDRYQIVLVGTDDNVDKKLPENIISIHRTENQAELAEIYTAADIFANPTREEVLGLVNIEALACGTPVVTFNSGGSPECIDENCGKVVDCDDIETFEREIKNICENKIFSRENCISRAKQFDMNDKFKEYVDLYE